MFLFKTQLIKTDVTAIKILKQYILVGIGDSMQVFNRKSMKEVKTIKVFEGQKIYGIVPTLENNKILLYGGLDIKIFDINKEFRAIHNYKAKDWILEAKWIGKDTNIAIICMHNSLHVWDLNSTISEEIQCEEICILYSAKICFENFDDLAIIAGTVYSDLVIWKPAIKRSNYGVVLKRLQKHKGVIFSIDYNKESGFICSTSDDRSAILWKISNKIFLNLENENVEINAVCQVYGHQSRIFRCKVLGKIFLTAGEDSLINIWSFSGNLKKKIIVHQGAPIWCLDCDESLNLVTTGGGDCGVTAFSIYSNFEERGLVLLDTTPKVIGNLFSGNLVVFAENGILYYYFKLQKIWKKIKKFENLKKYVLLEVSACKKLIALAGFQGEIIIYIEVQDGLKQINVFQTACKSRIYSLHWLTCKSFLTCQTEGRMTIFFLKNNKIFPISNFTLPLSKERWTTTAIFVKNNSLIVGDRKGNVYLYIIGKVEPVQTLKKMHNHLGVTKLINDCEKIISLGRNGLIKTFSLKNILELTSTNKLPFSWLVNIIGNLLLAFSSNNFVIWSLETRRIIFEKPCGGGHRSWDIIINDNKVTFTYIKDKIINMVNFDFKNFLPIDLIEGYQAREINSMKVLKIFNTYLLISGGEDTSLKISCVNENNCFKNLVSLKSHLSSIRTLSVCKIKNTESYLLFSAGGRAQIICWKLDINADNNTFNKANCIEQHSYYKVIEHEASEMRIMDLCNIEIKNKLMLFCACSDGNIKVFFVNLDTNGKYYLSLCRYFFYKLKCIVKINVINIFSNNILVTMATDGKIVFWDVTDIVIRECTCLFSIQAHQSGINSNSYILQKTLCVFATGGDDNALIINVLRFKENNNLVSIENVDSFVDVATHCAQITGIFINDKYILTSSIDQKVVLFMWKLENDIIDVSCITKYNTSLADLQGLECFGKDCSDIFIYGKGLEYIKFKKISCALK